MRPLATHLQALSLHPLQLVLNLPQLILLPLNVGLDHPGPLLELVFQVLHGIYLVGELHY